MNFPKSQSVTESNNIAYTASTSEVAMADHDMCGFHSRDYDILQTEVEWRTAQWQEGDHHDSWT